MIEWRVIPNTCGLYEVSNSGLVRRVDRNRLRSTSPQSNGYLRVNLSINGKAIHRMVHSIVASVFLGERPEGFQVNHKNGDKSDNRVENLEYLSPTDHAYHTGHVIKRLRPAQGSRHAMAVLTDELARQIHAEYSVGNITQRELSERFGVSQGNISLILNGKLWKHLGLLPASKRDHHLRGLDNPKGKVSAEMAEQISKLSAQGMSGPKIAAQLGIGSTTVYRFLRRH